VGSDIGRGDEGDRALDTCLSLLRPRIKTSRLSIAIRLAVCRLEERWRLRDPGLLILLELLVRDFDLRDSTGFSSSAVPYRASSSGDIGTGEEGERFAG